MSMLRSIAHQLSRENFGNCQPYSCHYYEWWRESGTERELMNHPQQGTQGRCFFVAESALLIANTYRNFTNEVFRLD